MVGDSISLTATDCQKSEVVDEYLSLEDLIEK
jgi:hypothetical protein